MNFLEFIKIAAAVAVSIAGVGALFYAMMAGTLNDKLLPIREELKEIRENMHSIDGRLSHLEAQFESFREDFASVQSSDESVTFSAHSVDPAGPAAPAVPTTLLVPSRSAEELETGETLRKDEGSSIAPSTGG